METFVLDRQLYLDCLNLMKVPEYIYISTALWGNRSGSTNVIARFINGKKNTNYLKSSELGANGRIMRNILDEQRKKLPFSLTGEKFCIFLVTSEVKPSKQKSVPLLHCNVLVAKIDRSETVTCKLNN